MRKDDKTISPPPVATKEDGPNGTRLVEHFGFHGLTVQVKSSSPQVLEQVRRDFSYFRRDPTPDAFGLVLDLRLEAPSYRDLPELPASFLTPRNVCYQHHPVSYIDYFGRGLGTYNRGENHCLMQADEVDFLREMAYLFILSRAGEHLDTCGLHRLHALALNYNGRAVLLLLPSGGGKSTMALNMLKEPGFTLLGEDTPLVDRRGRILPFPLCLGVRLGSDPGIPSQYLRTVQRMEFDPKTLIDIDYFAEKLSGPADPGLILVGQRNLGQASAIVPLARRRAFHSLIKNMVVGLGIYQGLEFMLERGTWELLSQGRTVSSRLYNSLRLLARTPSYRFVLGRDLEKNSQTLLDFVTRRLS